MYLDRIAEVVKLNQDIMIETSPQSIEIRLKRRRFEDGAMFGYDEGEDIDSITTKCILIFTPERKFLNKVGIFFEDELPIIAFFKQSDNVKRGDLFSFVIEGVEGQVEREFQVIDIKTVGWSFSNKFIYIVAPTR